MKWITRLILLVVPCRALNVPRPRSAPVDLLTRRESFSVGSTLLMAGVLLPNNVATARNLPDSTGADSSRAGTLETLLPVVTLREQVTSLQSMVTEQQPANVRLLRAMILEMRIPVEEATFKRIFDAYSDPISYKQRFLDQNAFLVYYSRGFDGVGRPSIESDLPVQQTMQYGARNEAWIAWKNLIDEVDYLSSHPAESSQSEVPELIVKSVSAIDSYLSLAPEDDVRKAKEIASAAR